MWLRSLYGAVYKLRFVPTLTNKISFGLDSSGIRSECSAGVTSEFVRCTSSDSYLLSRFVSLYCSDSIGIGSECSAGVASEFVRCTSSEFVLPLRNSISFVVQNHSVLDQSVQLARFRSLYGVQDPIRTSPLTDSISFIVLIRY
mgnify:CR=1 FL=1